MEGKGARASLTEKGEEQAKLLGKRLASIHAASDGAYKDFSLETLKSSMLTPGHTDGRYPQRTLLPSGVL